MNNPIEIPKLIVTCDCGQRRLLDNAHMGMIITCSQCGYNIELDNQNTVPFDEDLNKSQQSDRSDSNREELFRKANKLTLEGRYDEAGKIYKSFLIHNEDDNEAVYGLGYCCYKKGDFIQARLIIQRSKELGYPYTREVLQVIEEKIELLKKEFSDSKTPSDVVNSASEVRSTGSFLIYARPFFQNATRAEIQSRIADLKGADPEELKKTGNPDAAAVVKYMMKHPEIAEISTDPAVSESDRKMNESVELIKKGDFQTAGQSLEFSVETYRNQGKRCELHLADALWNLGYTSIYYGEKDGIDNIKETINLLLKQGRLSESAKCCLLASTFYLTEKQPDQSLRYLHIAARIAKGLKLHEIDTEIGFLMGESFLQKGKIEIAVASYLDCCRIRDGITTSARFGMIRKQSVRRLGQLAHLCAGKILQNPPGSLDEAIRRISEFSIEKESTAKLRLMLCFFQITAIFSSEKKLSSECLDQVKTELKNRKATEADKSGGDA